MIKHFCDVCGTEMTPENTKPLNGSLKKIHVRVVADEVFDNDRSRESAQETAMPAHEWCRYCILDAVYSLDDRPKERPYVDMDYKQRP